MPELDREKVAKVLEDSSAALKSMAAERDKLAATVSYYARHEEARKLAHAMHEKGLNREIEFGDLVDSLEKAASAGRLPAIQEAVNMVAPNMGFTGSLTHDDAPVGGSNSLESFILGNVG